MNCYTCINEELIWGGDHDSENSEYSIITNLSCPKCNAYVEVHWGTQDREEIPSQRGKE